MTESERKAIWLYGIMARDPVDALDAVTACTDALALDLLHQMLTAPGRANTDTKLNKIMAGPVSARLSELRGETPTAMLYQVMVKADAGWGMYSRHADRTDAVAAMDRAARQYSIVELTTLR